MAAHTNNRASQRRELSDAFARLAIHQPEFRPRASQRAMAEAVLEGLAGSRSNACTAIEAPTGVGKSLGYLIPLLIAARATGRRAIVCTATIALQEQLVREDIPKLQQIVGGGDLSAAISKGRAHYCCEMKLASLLDIDPNQVGLSLGADDRTAWSAPPAADRVVVVDQMRRALESSTWDGDLDGWPVPIDAALRGDVTTTAAACLGRLCPFAERCSFRVARRNVHAASLVIANQDILLAEVANPEAGVLPPLADSLVVIDEAHHFAEKATNHALLRTSLGMSRGVVARLPQLMRRAAVESRCRGAQPDDATAIAVDALRRALRRIHDAALALAAESRAPLVDLPRGIPTSCRPDAQIIMDRAAELSQWVHEARQALMTGLRAGTVHETSATQVLAALSNVSDTLSLLIRAFEMTLRSFSIAVDLPIATWFEIESVQGRHDAVLNVGPVSASAFLYERIWSVASGTVLTSATLTSFGRFDRLRSALGLPKGAGLVTLRLPSPFDLARQAQFVVPWMRSDPSDRDAHLAEVVEQLCKRIAQGEGTLVHFTSRRMMEAAYARLPEELQARVLMQGTIPKAELLRVHRERCAGDEGSILFGLNSLAVGVDLPGRQLTHVVITKLPFPVPDHPIDLARARWLRQRGKSYFELVALPETHRMLQQVAGRLLRREDDVGRITCLDRRLADRRYGRAMLDALPPYEVRIEGPAS